MLRAPLALRRLRDPRKLVLGDLGAQLVDDVRRGDRNHLERLVRLGLPEWKVKLALLRAAHELLELRLAIELAAKAGLSLALTNGLGEEIDSAAVVLGRTANRLALANAQEVEYPGMHERLAVETNRLAGLEETIHAIRQDIARLTLETDEPGDLTRAELALQSLGDAANRFG